MKRLVAILAAAVALLCSTNASAQWQRQLTPGDTLQSVRVLPNGNTVLSIYAPKARAVSVTGDIVPWGVQIKSAERNGVWSFEIPGVKPGAYRYHFVVDGVQVYDPKSPTTTQQSAVAVIEPNGKDFFSYNPDIEHGALAVRSYKSKVAGTTRTFRVWTPAGYETSKKKLPVFYLIHGGGDTDTSWPSVGCAGDILDNLYAEGKIVPMIVVMPNGSMDTKKFVEDLVGDIMPFIEKNYRVKTGAENTALAGLSMGGLETLDSFMAHPDMFGYINVMSSGWFTNNKQMYEEGEARLKEIAPTLNKTAKILKFTMGGEEDIAYANCKEMLKVFDKVGIKYEYSEMPGGHSWHVWRHDLYHFAPVLFK